MATSKTADKPSSKILSRRTLVVVSRDPMLKTPSVIWQHEKPILDEVFGDGNVTEVDPASLDEGFTAKAAASMLPYNKTQEDFTKPSANQGLGFVFIGNPEVEYQRLAEVYGKHPKENVAYVEKIYGRIKGGSFKSLLGEPELTDLPAKQLRGLIMDYGYIPDVHKEATADEKNAAIAKRKALEMTEGAELVKIAEEVGVQLG